MEDKKSMRVLMKPTNKDYETVHNYLHHNGCEHEHTDEGISYYA